jgi:diguanylate cyclase (GGDEF)-like protein
MNDLLNSDQEFKALLNHLQQFIKKINQNDLLKHLDQAVGLTTLERQILNLMIYGKVFGPEARQDYLTRLLDRTSFLDQLKLLLSKPNLNGHFSAIIFLDLDNFKAINDQYGHATGDQVLAIIGARISSSIRAYDLACRWGGDEFILVLQNIQTIDFLRQLSNRILTIISADLRLNSKESLQIFPSASIGVAVIDNVNLGPMDFIDRADKAMYRAKKAGKNCIEYCS